jgi:hypothetical protein
MTYALFNLLHKSMSMFIDDFSIQRSKANDIVCEGHALINVIIMTYHSGIPCSRLEVANNYFRSFSPFAVDTFRFSRFTHSPWLRVLKVFAGFACRILAVG